MKKQLGFALGCLYLAAPLVWGQAPAPDSATPSGLDQAKAEQQAAPVSQLDGALFYQLLIGEITAQEGDPAAGFALMLDAARKSGDAQLYQRATDIALQSRSGDAALQAAQAWKQALPASREANRYLLQILIALNRIADTEGPLRAEIKMAPDAEKAAVLAAVPRAYARASEKALASTVVEAALADYLNSPATAGAAWTTVGRMRLAAGDNTGAFEAARRGQAADATAQGPVLVALELMDPKMPEAEGLVKRYLAAPQDKAKAPSEIRMAYAQTLLGMLRYAEAMAQLQIVTRDKPEFAPGWLVLGSLQLQDNQLAQAQGSLERYVTLVGQAAPQAAEADNRRGLDQAYLALSQLAEKRKDYAAAEDWLGKIENSSDLAQAQTQFQIKYREEDFIPAQELAPSSQFLAEFEFNRANLDMFSSEGARSEIIIFPILREAWKNHAQRYALFVQRYLTCDAELSGTPDYIIATKSALGKTVLELPLVVVAEAKKNDFEQGWGQCLAELVAAQRINRDATFPVYCIVTDGNLWQCGKLVEDVLTKNLADYTLGNWGRLFGALNFIFQAISAASYQPQPAHAK